jgi:hypothetical protein
MSSAHKALEAGEEKMKADEKRAQELEARKPTVEEGQSSILGILEQ